MKKKKIVMILLPVICLLTGCGNPNNATTQSSEKKTEKIDIKITEQVTIPIDSTSTSIMKEGVDYFSNDTEIIPIARTEEKKDVLVNTTAGVVGVYEAQRLQDRITAHDLAQLMIAYLDEHGYDGSVMHLEINRSDNESEIEFNLIYENFIIEAYILKTEPSYQIIPRVRLGENERLLEESDEYVIIKNRTADELPISDSDIKTALKDYKERSNIRRRCKKIEFTKKETKDGSVIYYADASFERKLNNQVQFKQKDGVWGMYVYFPGQEVDEYGNSIDHKDDQPGQS